MTPTVLPDGVLMPLEIVIEDERWQSLALEDLANRAVGRVLDHLGLPVEDCEIALLACDDARIATLNTEFRGKAVPTNVLSWPACDLAAAEEGDLPLKPEPDFTGEIALGDIAVSYDTCVREASEASKTPEDHVTHLIVHGLLHLLGYDHIRDHDATLMEELETAILGSMGINDPYMDSEGQIGPDLE